MTIPLPELVINEVLLRLDYAPPSLPLSLSHFSWLIISDGCLIDFQYPSWSWGKGRRSGAHNLPNKSFRLTGRHPRNHHHIILSSWASLLIVFWEDKLKFLPAAWKGEGVSCLSFGQLTKKLSLAKLNVINWLWILVVYGGWNHLNSDGLPLGIF